MNRSDIRAELLAEHAALRALIESVRATAAGVHGSETKRADLRMAMGRLVHALREHNRHEEQLLRAPSMAARADELRERIMNSAHQAEHRELTEAFVDASSVSDAALSGGVLDGILDRLLAHMAREESAGLDDDTAGNDLGAGAS